MGHLLPFMFVNKHSNRQAYVSKKNFHQITAHIWSSGNAFVSGAASLRLKSWASQIGHSVANRPQCGTPLQYSFERSCAVRLQ